MNIEAISAMNLCKNARPPSPCKIKREQESEIKDLTAQFLAKGGEIKQMESVGSKSKPMSYKEVNDSTFVGVL